MDMERLVGAGDLQGSLESDRAQEGWLRDCGRVSGLVLWPRGACLPALGSTVTCAPFCFPKVTDGEGTAVILELLTSIRGTPRAFWPAMCGNTLGTVVSLVQSPQSSRCVQGGDKPRARQLLSAECACGSGYNIPGWKYPGTQ